MGRCQTFHAQSLSGGARSDNRLLSAKAFLAWQRRQAARLSASRPPVALSLPRAGTATGSAVAKGSSQGHLDVFVWESSLRTLLPRDRVREGAVNAQGGRHSLARRRPTDTYVVSCPRGLAAALERHQFDVAAASVSSEPDLGGLNRAFPLPVRRRRARDRHDHELSSASKSSWVK